MEVDAAMNPQKHRVRIPIDPLVFRAHRQISSWKSPCLVLLCYVGAIALVVLGGALSNWWLAPLSFVMVAGVQSHLSILLHEGSHYLLHPNKKINELFANLAGIPLLFTAKNYRVFHLQHHEHSGDKTKDPEVALYREQNYFYKPHQSWASLSLNFAKDLLGYNAFFLLVGAQKYYRSLPGYRILTAKEALLCLLYLGGPVLVALFTGLWLELLLLWYLPLFTLTFFFVKLHIYGEHTGKSGPTEFERTWHHRPHFLFDFFVYPIRSGFHLEHHLYPSVPWYHMRSFHAYLMTIPDYRNASANLDSDGYFFGKNTILRSMLKSSQKSCEQHSERP